MLRLPEATAQRPSSPLGAAEDRLPAELPMPVDGFGNSFSVGDAEGKTDPPHGLH